MKALAITFLALLGLPILGAAGCATTEHSELSSGWGHFQQVGGRGPQKISGNNGGIIIWYDNKASVFITGNHVKTFNFCGSTDAIEFNSDSNLNLKFHWDAKSRCDMVDDIEIGR